MQSNPKNIIRLINSANLLSMIFCMGEAMPVTHLGMFCDIGLLK